MILHGTERTHRRRAARAALALASAALAGGLATAPAAALPTIERVSVSSTGEEQDEHAHRAAEATVVSDDGRYAAFVSDARNLVPVTTNPRTDVFLRDRVAGTTELISVSTAGVPGDQRSHDAVISRDGRWVAFMSEATNLVPGDTNDRSDLFLRDRVTGTTERVSVGDRGQQIDASAYDLAQSARTGVSDDGRYVSFISTAANLVPGDTTTDYDLFVRDRLAGRTHLISWGDISVREAAMSRDGRRYAFVTDDATVLPGDANGSSDVFWRDALSGVTLPVSVSSAERPSLAGEGSNRPSISPDGRFVAFESDATNFGPAEAVRGADLFLRDMLAGTTRQVTVAPDGRDLSGWAGYALVNGDGRYVSFLHSGGAIDGANGVFRRDMLTERTERITARADGTPADGWNYAITSDGAHVGLYSNWLVADEVNTRDDNYVADFRPLGTPRDAYADELAPGDTATIAGGADSLGAPDGAAARVSGSGDTHATWLMDDPGTGPLTLHLGDGDSSATGASVQFIDASRNILSTYSVARFASRGRTSVVVPYGGSAPYSAIRIRTGSGTELQLDALEADGIAPW